MKYLKLFKTDVDYQNYINSNDCIKPNVSYSEDTDNLYYNPHINLPDNPPEDNPPENEDFIILTYESNPAVMDICYYQGWAASPDVMYKSEAEKVTDIGTAFKGLQGNTNTYGYAIYGYGSNELTEAFTSFDEFKYFTGVTSISENAFRDCSRLTSIVIPDSVTYIGSYAFYECSGLTSITIGNSVTTIGDYAFSGCTGLTSIVIPDSVTTIDSYAFYGCTGLTSITIGNSVTVIGNYAFRYCPKLTSITIPDSVTTIYNYAFSGCTGLTSINIPDSVTTIGVFAFNNCSGLTSITIGNSVTTIGDYAFDGCSGLTSITCRVITTPTINSNTFRDIKSNGVLYYPSGSAYSRWMSTRAYYLGYYNWTSQEISREI